MKICIIGASGVIGSKLFEYFSKSENDVIPTFNSNKVFDFKESYHLDITDMKHTIDFMVKNNPDVVIHTSAITNVDQCEENKELAYLVNVKGTENVLEGCKKINAKIAYVSTSAVFDGKQKKFFETDTTNPKTYYGLTKTKSEKIIQKSKIENLILRIDQPYCWNEKWQHTNSVIRTIETLESGNRLREINDWYNNPTYVPDFVLATANLIDKKQCGIFHVVGPEFINRVEWSKKVADVFGLEKSKIDSIDSKELKLPVKRLNVNLDNSKVEKVTGIKMRNIKESLQDMKKSRN